MILSADGIDPAGYADRLEEGAASELDRFCSHVEASIGARVLVDCTAGGDVPALYPRLLSRGVAVVTANKIGFAGPQNAFAELMSSRLGEDRGLYYETTVGAALPVIETLKNLIATGDEIERIEGVFSGTLGFVLGRTRDGGPFAEAVRKAHQLGYTEPDPREDLSGMDVARKLLVLARTAGAHLEPSDVAVTSLLPEGEAASGPLERFWEWMGRSEHEIEARARRAREEGRALTYLARFADGRASVGLEVVSSEHPAASLRGTENVFVFTSRRHHDFPLVVRGKGAGTDVTASGVFPDILRACVEMFR